MLKNLPTHYFIRARDLKNSGKYGSGLSCHWALFTTWAFGFELHLIFHRIELKETGLIFYLADFHGRNWRFRAFMRTRLNIEPYSLLKPSKASKVGFIFIGSNSEPKILQTLIAWRKQELGRRLGLKVRFKG